MTTTYKPLRYRIKSIEPTVHLVQWKLLFWWETEEDRHGTIEEAKTHIDRSLSDQKRWFYDDREAVLRVKARAKDLKRWGFPKYEYYP